MYEILGVVIAMMRFSAVTGRSCFFISSCMVSLTIFWLAEVTSLLTLL